MEITLSKYSNFLVGWKDAVIKINNDEMTYKYVANPDKGKTIHYSSILYGLISIENDTEEISFVVAKKNKELIYLHYNKNNDYDKFHLFCNYFNYLKYTFRLNEESFKFLNKERYKLNSKELYLSMNLYVNSKYFVEIYSNTKSNRLMATSISDAIDKRVTVANMEKTYHSKEDENVFLVEDIKKDIKQIFYNEDIEKRVAYYLMRKDNNKDYKLENIDKIREYYLALIRILIEIRRTVNEKVLTYNVKDEKILTKEENCSLFLNKMDIYSRLLFAKGESVDFAELLKQNQSLSKEYKELRKTNKNSKIKLKEFIDKNPYQLFFCYKCGNLLFKTDNTPSTCNFDPKCESNSFFYCKLCAINYCTYCIYYPRKLQCIRGHLLKTNISSEKESICSLCENTIPVNQCNYTCNECDSNLRLCAFCYDDYKNNSPSLYKCSCGRELYWKRGVVCKCRKCLRYSKCFWFCFFCNNYYCAKCYTTNRNFCGLMHRMDEVNLNLIEDSKLSNRNSTMNGGVSSIGGLFSKKAAPVYQSGEKGKFANKQLNDIIHGYQLLHKTNCDVCRREFCFKFYICYRCMYIKCVNCMNNTVTFKSSVAKKVFI